MTKLSRFGVVVATLLLTALCLPPTVAQGAFSVTSATLAGPASIEKGKSATYSFDLKGKDAGAVLGTSLLWSVIEIDSVSDDELIEETRFVVSDDATGNWSYSQTFELKCTDDCYLMGEDDTDDEVAPGMVYVLIEHSLTGSDAASTNTLNIDCVKKVPEPSSSVLAMLGLIGGFGYARRARRLGSGC